ncbi:MAG TPA: serine/threonine-protein kinase [Gaiellaceae bacterium]|nr:serine/threonine-protein kinase [Gaiellaceae bacterium]
MARTAAAVAPGSLVLGRYRPIRPLGSGSSGSVWLAVEEEHGREVALKIVPREGNAGARAEREASAAAKLRHQRCLRAHALARDPGHVYIVYEYVPGRTLREAMREGDVDDESALEAAAQILDALASAHARGIVHRDVKPANVLLADGPDVSVKLFDFGLAVMHEQETLTAVGDIPGTLAYISPERLHGEPGRPAADVWSVGVLLWEAFAGRHPFWGGSLLDTARRIEEGAPSLETVRPDLPPAIVECVDRALAVDAKRRPSASALAARLRKVAPGLRRRPLRRPPDLELARAAAARRVVPAAAAVLFTAWSAATLPFFPAGWPLALAALAGVLALVRQRLALAFCLAVPVLPLGNYALGLALVYALAALVWLAVAWRDPESGLFVTVGPLLASLGLVAALPVAGLVVRNPLRRGLQVAAAVLVAAAVAGAARLDRLGIAASDRPGEAAAALARAVERATVVQAVVLALVAVALPFARARGPWAAAGLVAFFLAAQLLLAPALSAWPIVGIGWVLCLALVAEPYARAWTTREPDPRAVETVATVRHLQPVQKA